MKMLRMAKAKKLIICTLEEREYQPVELLKHLQTSFDEGLLKEAIAQLTASRAIEFTRTRHLKLLRNS